MLDVKALDGDCVRGTSQPSQSMIEADTDQNESNATRENGNGKSKNDLEKELFREKFETALKRLEKTSSAEEHLVLEKQNPSWNYPDTEDLEVSYFSFRGKLLITSL